MNEREAMIASYSFAAGWDAALDEARGAIEGQHLTTDDGEIIRQGGSWENAIDRCLAVIEALREKP